MSEIAIQMNGIGKQYHIGGPQKAYNRLGEQLVDTLTAPVRRVRNLFKNRAAGVAELEDTIWALKDVSLEVDHGEVIGIIGGNGAGKSTMLKILSRITEPTEGYADIYGRIGSLLEVGTGFHPELTGRENVYLNGAILGMTKKEIERKFPEIVEFAEIGKFMNTPVKHYSSGMYVRLAFSVAAHLDPEILLVDEVLAVGDVAFQKKCLGKMGDVAKRGRTVLFVSHNMGIIQALCERGIYLKEGRIAADGSIMEVVGKYLNSLERLTDKSLLDRTDRTGWGKVRLTNVEITDGRNPPSNILKSGGPARFEFEVSGMLANLSCSFLIINEIGQPLTVMKSDVPGPEDRRSTEAGVKFACEVDELLLIPGRYHINVFIRGLGERQDLVEAAKFFDVEVGQLRGRTVTSIENKQLSFCMPHRWVLPKED
jgi:lipopolysaccharide transport system ATP-binding protein